MNIKPIVKDLLNKKKVGIFTQDYKTAKILFDIISKKVKVPCLRLTTSLRIIFPKSWWQKLLERIFKQKRFKKNYGELFVCSRSLGFRGIQLDKIIIVNQHLMDKDNFKIFLDDIIYPQIYMGAEVDYATY